MSNDQSGPEYLSFLADQAAANNDSVVADQLRTLSKRWQDEQRQLQVAYDCNTQLQRRIDEVRVAVAA